MPLPDVSRDFSYHAQLVALSPLYSSGLAGPLVNREKLRAEFSVREESLQSQLAEVCEGGA